MALFQRRIGVIVKRRLKLNLGLFTTFYWRWSIYIVWSLIIFKEELIVLNSIIIKVIFLMNSTLTLIIKDIIDFFFIEKLCWILLDIFSYFKRRKVFFIFLSCKYWYRWCEMLIWRRWRLFRFWLINTKNIFFIFWRINTAIRNHRVIMIKLTSFFNLFCKHHSLFKISIKIILLFILLQRISFINYLSNIIENNANTSFRNRQILKFSILGKFLFQLIFFHIKVLFE